MDQTDDRDDATRQAFETMLYERMQQELSIGDRTTLPTSENGLYLARTVGPVLTKVLAEVNVTIQFDIDQIRDSFRWCCDVQTIRLHSYLTTCIATMEITRMTGRRVDR